MSDFAVALIIVCAFFLSVFGIIIEGIIRQWIADNNMRKSYAGKIDKMMQEGWDF